MTFNLSDFENLSETDMYDKLLSTFNVTEDEADDYSGISEYIIKTQMTEENTQKCIELIDLYARVGNFDAGVSLSKMYTFGVSGVPIDYNLGYMYATMNEDQSDGDTTCNYILGFYHENGLGGCKKSRSEAYGYHCANIEIWGYYPSIVRTVALYTNDSRKMTNRQIRYGVNYCKCIYKKKDESFARDEENRAIADKFLTTFGVTLNFNLPWVNGNEDKVFPEGVTTF